MLIPPFLIRAASNRDLSVPSLSLFNTYMWNKMRPVMLINSRLRGRGGSLIRRRYPALAVPAISLAVVVAAVAMLPGGGGADGDILVLNPQSHPLVGGAWAVHLEVVGGGDLSVEAVDGTIFGRDVEFARMYRADGAALRPSGLNPLTFADVPKGYWTLEVGVLTGGPHHLAFGMGGATARASNTASLANVTSTTPDGRHGPGQSIDIRVNFTEPVSLDLFSIRDGRADGAGGTFEELFAAFSITTAQIGPSNHHYALVAAAADSGVQIINITDPASPTAVANVTEGSAYPELKGAISITTAQIGSSHYALVASLDDDGVQIINVTDPASPTPVANVTDGPTYPTLEGASSITTAQIGSSHYALVASLDDSGVQIIDITDPASPTPVANVTDGPAYPTLKEAVSITTAQIGPSNHHYALVAAGADNGVQIINITDPASPTPVANLTDGTAYPELEGAVSITTAQIGSSHYALVASQRDDGVQIINITNPASPTPVANVTDGTAYPVLLAAAGITTAQIGSSHYALVASQDDNGVQIINITDPASPTPVANLTDGTAYPELSGAASITTAQIGPSNHHYALVAASYDSGVQIINITDPASPTNPLSRHYPYLELDLAGDRRAAYAGQDHGDHALVFGYTVRDGDQTSDLAYAGTGALHLGRSILEDADNSTALLSVALPTPGQPNSLSHNKQIVLGNAPPTVNAGDDQAVDEGQTVTLAGTATDPDPDHADTLTYSWSQTSPASPTVSFDSPNSLSTNFTAPQVAATTAFIFTLTVNDGTVEVSDTLQVTITDSPNSPPEVGAGDDQEVVEGATVSLSGTATDDDAEDTLAYSWTHDGTLAITITDSDSLSASFMAPNVAADTAITVTLTVNDGTVDVTDTLQVTITDSLNSPPVVGAGADQEVVEGATVSLSGTVSDDDPEDTLTYSWTHDDTLAITITGSDSLSASFTAPDVAANTTITVTLTVNDGTVGVSDTLQVTITDSPNSPPTVDAGPAQTVNEGVTVTLTGGATDSDHADTLTYSWSQTSPASPTVSLGDPASLTTTFTAPPVTADTAFTFTLSVSDGTDTSTDAVTVTVNDRPVQTDSRSKTWTVDGMVGIMGGKGQHDLEMISRCDEGTTPTGASTELHLLGLLGQASYGTFNVDMESTWVWIIEAYRLAYHYLDTGKDVISEDVYEDGITLDQYIDAAPGDVFEYPDGNYTKAQLGSMTAWSASIDWTGDGSCSLDFRQETWAP